MKKWFVIYYCAIAYFLTRVDAKICERIEAVTRMVEVTFSTAYIATYQGQCYYGCIKTRWATSVNRRYVPKREWKTIKYCCSGYMRTDDSSSDSDIVCEPICMPACKNGHCKAPAECACDTGYIPDPKDGHNCVSSCEKGCDHGACVAPDKCLPIQIPRTARRLRDKRDDYDQYDEELSYDDYYPDDTNMDIMGSYTNSNDAINTGSGKSMSWLQQHWVSIFIPILVILMAAVIMLLVWRWTHIIIFFKGRSYVVEGDPVDSNGPRPFEDIQISAINEKEKTAQK